MGRMLLAAGLLLLCAVASSAEASPREGGWEACQARSETACRASLMSQLAQLVPRDTPAGRDLPERAVRCQNTMRAATRSYAFRRIPERIRGHRAAPRERLLRDVSRACDGVPIVGRGARRLPRLGGACAPLREAAESVEGDAVGRCLSAAIEGILNRVLPPLQPNIVVVYTDDQRWDTLEFMPRTLDRLADQGMVFHNSFVTTPVCGPSRASLLTGQYAHTHGILTNGGSLDPTSHFDEDDTVGRWLEAEGYQTAFIGKYINETVLLPPGKPRGWTSWQTFRGGARYYDYDLDVDGEIESFGSEPDDYSTDVLAERALRFIETHRAEPFFVVLSLFAPHLPAIPADRHMGSLAGLPPARPPNFQEADLSGKPLWIRFQKTIASPASAIDAFRIDQLETLAAVDEAVEALSNLLDELGLTDNTVVVFTSDNGYHWGEHWWTTKFTGYEESLRVPLVVRYPAAHPLPSSTDALALNIDLAPTFAELAGAPAPSAVDGRSLAPLLRGESWSRLDFLFEIFDDFIVRPHAGVRTVDSKYIETGQGGFEELYDLVADPFELGNRVQDPSWREELDRLRGRLYELRH